MIIALKVICSNNSHQFLWADFKKSLRPYSCVTLDFKMASILAWSGFVFTIIKCQTVWLSLEITQGITSVSVAVPVRVMANPIQMHKKVSRDQVHALH